MAEGSRRGQSGAAHGTRRRLAKAAGTTREDPPPSGGGRRARPRTRRSHRWAVEESRGGSDPAPARTWLERKSRACASGARAAQPRRKHGGSAAVPAALLAATATAPAQLSPHSPCRAGRTHGQPRAPGLGLVCAAAPARGPREGAQLL